MATPNGVMIGNLNNRWILNKTLTGDLGPLLKLQGVSWIIRTTVPLITITIEAHEYSDNNIETDAESNQPITGTRRVDLRQIFSGGFSETLEQRTLNWRPQRHSDYIFGSVTLQACYIGGRPDKSRIIRPAIQMEPEMLGKDEIEAWLAGKLGMVEGDKHSSGLLVEPSTRWIYTVERKLGGGLSAQVWGFEIIHGIRYLCRRIVVMDSEGKYTCGRLVYDFCE